MTNDIIGIVLVFLQEVVDARECYLIDILVDFLFGHTDTAVADSECTFLFIKAHSYCQVAQFALEVTLFGKCFHLLRSIYGI